MPLSRSAFAVSLAVLAPFAQSQDIGPSTASEPYLVPTAAGARTVALLTVGDSVNLKPDGVTPYRMVGIPDGLGAFDAGDGMITLLMNHEISFGSGIVRTHGANGAFVSKWTIDPATFEVIEGADLTQRVATWDVASGAYTFEGTQSMGRLCSADLPPRASLYNEATGLGTTDRIFFSGEEVGSRGRAFAHVVTGPDAGDSYELAGLGNLSFENVSAAPGSGDVTVVAGLDDSSTGQLYFYVGAKSDSGSAIERAGLVGGTLLGLRIPGMPIESDAGFAGAVRFEMHDLGDAAPHDGSWLSIESNANGVTAFARPEDGHWNPSDPNQFLFNTTGSSGRPTRFWRISFDDVAQPHRGGTIEILINGDTALTPHDLDNLTVDRFENAVLQEDPGSASRLARVWNYDLNSGDLVELARHNPLFFRSGAANFLTTNEESSGVIDASEFLGPGWFLLDVQAHTSAGDAELVERGQLLALYNPLADLCPADFAPPWWSITDLDVSTFVERFLAREIECDLNLDGVIDFFDVAAFLESLGAGCP